MGTPNLLNIGMEIRFSADLSNERTLSRALKSTAGRGELNGQPSSWGMFFVDIVCQFG